MVGDLIKQLKKDGIGIFLISHDIHDVFDLADRVTVQGPDGREIVQFEATAPAPEPLPDPQVEMDTAASDGPE